ncbi:helix-turn-helix domain-containing protein [Priestia aryabhattai]
MLRSNFNGDRLKTARLYRSKTISDIATELGVSKQMVSKYENGKSTPSSEMLWQIENTLSFPRSYFFEHDREMIKVGNTYFRSLASTSKKEQEIQNVKLMYLSKIYRCLAEFIKFPKLNIYELEDNLMTDVEHASLEIRKHWGIGQEPITNMVRLLEANGIIVATSQTNVSSIDAFTQKQQVNTADYYFVVLGKDKGNKFRRQFDAAHELGHILLHDPYLNLIEIDKDEHRDMEKEANEFAAALLLPAEEFSKDVQMHPIDLNHYVHLKKKWFVSVSAMTVRAFKLGLISYNQYHYLQRQISKNGWRKEEPFDQQAVPSAPVLLKKATKLILENKKLSGLELLNKLAIDYDLSLAPNEFESLIGLEKDTLLKYKKDEDALVLQLKK